MPDTNTREVGQGQNKTSPRTCGGATGQENIIKKPLNSRKLNILIIDMMSELHGITDAMKSINMMQSYEYFIKLY